MPREIKDRRPRRGSKIGAPGDLAGEGMRLGVESVQGASRGAAGEKIDPLSERLSSERREIFTGMGKARRGESRAKGGPVKKGRTYKVGEKGPEKFVPKKSTRKTTATKKSPPRRTKR